MLVPKELADDLILAILCSFPLPTKVSWRQLKYLAAMKFFPYKHFWKLATGVEKQKGYATADLWENSFTSEHKKKMGQGMQMPTWKDASPVHWMINKAVFALMQQVFKFFLLDQASDKKLGFDIDAVLWELSPVTEKICSCSISCRAQAVGYRLPQF